MTSIRTALLRLLSCAALAHSRCVGRLFDRRHAVSTAADVELADLPVPRGKPFFGERYEATPTTVLPTVLPRLRPSFAGFTFVDLGSGKGRVLLQASHFDFRRILGVEFAEPLHEVATRNIACYRHTQQRCRDITSLNVAAERFAFPDDDLVVFMFNAFRKPLLACLLARLEASHRAHPRTMYVVFVNPDEKNEVLPLLNACGFLKRRDLFRGPVDKLLYYLRSPYRVVAYETRDHPV